MFASLQRGEAGSEIVVVIECFADIQGVDLHALRDVEIFHDHCFKSPASAQYM